MATPMPPAAPYDDGSSTESEYYFDPAEEAEEEAAYAWTHERDTPRTQEPTSYGNEGNIAIKQEYREYEQLQQDVEKLALPQGSEWSHGAASTTVYDNAVEQALAMAQSLTETQREEPWTDDTMNSNASPTEQKEEAGEKQEKVMAVLKKKEVKIKRKLVSLKGVKTPTTPASVTKAVAVGLRRSPSTIDGVSREMQKELSVARSQWKSTASQSSSQKPSPRHIKAKLIDEKKTQPIQKEGTRKSPSVRKSEPEKVSSSRRTEHSKTSTSRRKSRSRSPSIHRRKRSRSPSVRRRNHSKSPSRRTVHEQSFSPSRRFSKRNPSRSPSRRRVDEKRRRSRSRSPDHQYNSDRRSRRSYRRSRSPSPPRVYFSNRRSRSRSWDRRDSRPHYTSNEKRPVYSTTYGKRDLDPHRESGAISRESQIQRQSRDNHNAKEKQAGGQRIGQERNQRSHGSGFHLNTDRGASKPQFHETDPFRSSRPMLNKGACFFAVPNAVESSKRSPRDPRIRHRVEPVAAVPEKSKAPTYDHDPFERRVFKLKLQEADADEKLSGQRLSEAERALYERKFYKIGLERARLENQNLERFEKLYATIKVSDVALKRYQDNRDFAWRVICFKQRQASLQQQKDLFVSEQVTKEKWRQLDEDRKKLMAENAHMFHTVMMESNEDSQSRENGKTNLSGKRAIGNIFQRGQPKFKRRAPEVTQPNHSTTSSRVVVGAALQLQGDRIRSNTFDPLHSRPKNTPWFLKG